MQAAYRRWVGLNKCLALAFVDDDAKDVARCISPYAGEVPTEERMKQGLQRIVQVITKGRSNATRRTVGYGHLKVKRVFTGEALCQGLRLDLTLGEEQMRRQFRNTGVLSRASEYSDGVTLVGSGDECLLDMLKMDLQGWCELKDKFFQDHPEILTELTVHLVMIVPDVGMFRTFLDCTPVSVDEPNFQGTKSSASVKDVNVVVAALYKRGRINPLSLSILR